MVRPRPAIRVVFNSSNSSLETSLDNNSPSNNNNTQDNNRIVLSRPSVEDPFWAESSGELSQPMLIDAHPRHHHHRRSLAEEEDSEVIIIKRLEQ